MKDQEILVQRLRMEMRSKIFQIESFYNKMFSELYSKRQKFMLGEEDNPEYILKQKLKKLKIDDPEFTNQEKGVPRFWVKALENIEYKFPQEINKKDFEILSLLKNIYTEESENGSLTIKFVFETNKYFYDKILYKKFILDEKYSNLLKIECSNINWSSKENNPFYEEVKEDPIRKDKKRTSKIQYHKF